MWTRLQQLASTGRLHPARVLLVLLLLLAIHATMYHFQLTSQLPALAQQLVDYSNWIPTIATSTGSPGGGHVTTSTRGSSLMVVRAERGTFTERLKQYNLKLSHVRRQLLLSIVNTTLSGGNANYGRRTVRVVWGGVDGYMNQLVNSTDITTVALAWRHPRTHWNSLADYANVLDQQYYEWTADDRLCTWIETPRTTKAKYDAVYNRTCSRNMGDTARPTSLRAVYLNAKPINPRHYWPNDGNSYPAHFYTTTPPYVVFMHIHRDAVVTELGDVITADTKLVLYACSHDVQPPTSQLADRLRQIPRYDEVYVISQRWGRGVYHRMAEIVPRLVPGLDLLKSNPDIRIVGPERRGGRLGELMDIIGLDSSRLVTGLTRARIVYQPRSTGCGFANVQESQLLARLYGDYIRASFPAEPRNRLVLIRRSRLRRFTEQQGIERVLERAARDFNLTLTMFIDNPVPSLNQTMVWFHSAVVVVAPCGAGESNLYFSQPGTFVVEGVCNRPHVNLCFQRLAHILGHHWHGITSRGGCERVVDVSAHSVELAVRHILELRRRTS